MSWPTNLKLIYGAGTYGTLMQACFLLSANFGDVLLVRVCLCCAYVLGIVNAALGMPQPWNFGPTGLLAYGSLGWAVLCLCFQAAALSRLLYEERSVAFDSENDEQLWRLFMRRAGMHRVDFLEVVKRGTFRRVAKGDVIYDVTRNDITLHLMVEGIAHWQLTDHPDQEGQRFHSGEMFDLSLMNLFGVHVGFTQHLIKRVVAETDCLLFTWPLKAVMDMGSGAASGAVAGYWRNMALYQLGAAFNRRHIYGMLQHRPPMYFSTGQLEPPEWEAEGARSRDFTDPLRPDEMEPGMLRKLSNLAWSTFGPLPPKGIRHKNMPATGALARLRVVVQMHYEHYYRRGEVPVELSRAVLADLQSRPQGVREPLLGAP